MELRDYQTAAVKSIFDYFKESSGNPLVAMPTGCGKSVILGKFIREAYQAYPGQRFVMLTHVKELISQNYERLMKLWPTAPAGIFSAGLGKKETWYPITFAGIASVAKCPEVFGHIDIVFIDEAHLLGPKDDSMYQRFILALRAKNPNVKVIGFTATPYRLGQGSLTASDGLFTDVCFDMTGIDPFNWLINQGYLIPLIPKRTDVELNVENVKIHGGEYIQKDLQAAVDKDELTAATLRETIDLAGERAHWLIFASGVEHAVHVRDMLDSLGISAGVVHSKMTTEERDATIANFKQGKIRALVNNNILTTGFDYSGVDMIVMLRPTQSPGLWVQMLGRGTRPIFPQGMPVGTAEERLAAIHASEKHSCLVLDFAGNTKRLGPINDPVLPRRKGEGGGGAAPVKVCEACGTYNHTSVRVCTCCGAEFPKSIKIAYRASTAELIAASQPNVETFNVDRVVYQLYTKKDRPDSVRVSYYCGLRLFQEWLCFEHVGYARKKARDAWHERLKVTSVAPESSKEALARMSELKVPKQIRVWLNKQHPEVMSCIF